MNSSTTTVTNKNVKFVWEQQERFCCILLFYCVCTGEPVTTTTSSKTKVPPPKQRSQATFLQWIVATETVHGDDDNDDVLKQIKNTIHSLLTVPLQSIETIQRNTKQICTHTYCIKCIQYDSIILIHNESTSIYTTNNR